MTKALILIDIQNDYFCGGNMELVGMEQAAKNASKILANFRREKLPIFHVQHIANRKGATFFLPDTVGVEIHNDVAPFVGEMIIQKHYPNSFRETGLLEKLRERNIKELIIVGAMSHMCIDATTRAAFDFQFICTVVEDACATRNLLFNGEVVPAKQVHAGFMSALQSVNANVISTEMYLQQTVMA